MKKWMSYSCIALATVLTWACDKGEISSNVSMVSSFENGFDGWSVDLAEYNTSMDSSTIEFKYAIAKMPSDSTKKGLRVQSHNRSDDMFMYAKKKISGLDSKKPTKFSLILNLAHIIMQTALELVAHQGVRCM